MGASQLRPHRIAATGDLETVAVHVAVKKVTFRAVGGVGTLVLRDGDASGEIMVDISVLQNDTRDIDFGENDLPTRDDALHNLHATIANGVAIVYTKG